MKTEYVRVFVQLPGSRAQLPGSRVLCRSEPRARV